MLASPLAPRVCFQHWGKVASPVNPGQIMEIRSSLPLSSVSGELDRRDGLPGWTGDLETNFCALNLFRTL